MPTPSFPTLTAPDGQSAVKITHKLPLFSNIVVTSASGKEVRDALYPAARYRWELEISILSAAVYASVKAFFLARNGSFEAFNFTDSDGTYLVRFEEDSHDFSTQIYGLWDSVPIKLITTDN